MTRAICVLGMHRSGTSLVARLLEELGVYFGEPEDLLPANYANPLGYWELRAIAETHDLLLQELSRRWDTAFPLPEEWHREPFVEPYRERLERAVLEQLAEHGTFGWKDPRTSLTLPLWNDLLDALGLPAHYVMVVRNPLDVAHSLVARDGFEPGDALGLWYHYNLEILTGTADRPRTTVRYEDLLERKSGVVERLVESLGLEWAGDRALGPEVMDPALCHSRSTDAEVGERAPGLVASLYELILEFSRGRIGRRELDARAGELHREWHCYAALLSHDLREATRVLERQEDRMRRAEASYGKERQRRMAAENELRSREQELKVVLGERRRLSAVLEEIHDSRWWKMAESYWRVRRWLSRSD